LIREFVFGLTLHSASNIYLNSFLGVEPSCCTYYLLLVNILARHLRTNQNSIKKYLEDMLGSDQSRGLYEFILKIHDEVIITFALKMRKVMF